MQENIKKGKWCICAYQLHHVTEAMKKRKLEFGLQGTIIIVLCAIMLYLGNGMVAIGQNIFLSQFSETRGWDYNLLLQLSTYAGWIGVAFTTLFTQLIVKFKSKRMALVALAIGGVSCILYGRSVRIEQFFLFSVINVLCSVIYNNLVPSTVLNSWFPKKRGRALSFAMMGYPLGDITFAAMITSFIALVGFNNSFSLLAIIFFLMVIFVFFGFANTPEEKGCYPDNDDNMSLTEYEENKKSVMNYRSEWTIRRLVKTKVTWQLGIGIGLLWMITIGIVTQVVPRLVSLGYERDFAVSLLAINGIFGLVGSYLWGNLANKFGVKKVVLACCVYYVLALVLIITQTDKVGVVFTTILTGVGTGCVNLKPNIIGMVFGRWDFASANRVLSPVTNFLKCSSYLVVAAGLKCVGGYNMVYAVFIGVAVVSFLVFLPLEQKCIGKQ